MNEKDTSQSSVVYVKPGRIFAIWNWIRVFYTSLMDLIHYLGKPELIHAIVQFVAEESSADIELIRRVMCVQVCEK